MTGAGESGTGEKPGEVTMRAGRQAALTHLAGPHAASVGEVGQEAGQGGTNDRGRLPVVGRTGGAAKVVSNDGHTRAEADVVGVYA